MILDNGICTVFRKTDAADPGDIPDPTYRVVAKSWYSEINFETRPVWNTDARQSLRTDARIRILQDRSLQQHDVVVLRDVNTLAEVPEGVPVYRITRAYHGEDEAGPTRITDLTLEVTTP